MNILILGGTTEANALAERLAGDQRHAVMLSLAGRTRTPRLPPVATRIGGFGGADGLADYLRAHAIGVLVDATHPFAAGISGNAVVAAERARVALVALERPAWQPVAGDRWTEVATLEAAANSLPDTPERVFLTVGRQSLAPFAVRPQHHYVIRVIDPPVIPAAMTDTEIVVGRGPFGLEEEIATLRAHRIDRLVTKNSGGGSAYAKLAAARVLGLPVLLVARPPSPARAMRVDSVEAAVEATEGHCGDLAKRSV